ncbi:hypothetical protein MESS2_1620010 [Mesorhizobium metallidurans STM 2683]|uniref:Uncharacterized protein n=1 Tax=Mesorhizobium metallidurans STM 2683 TaxID=1297569 RepID=M5EN76_9HYPH|nr:hypothetical protein MESS2_1620010 [Mesorhizobium metallidurans STM 2683]
MGTVYFFGSRSALTCPYVSGMDTVTPSLARGDSGATVVACDHFGDSRSRRPQSLGHVYEIEIGTVCHHLHANRLRESLGF